MGRARIGDYLLGMEGVALMRDWLERRPGAAEARIAEIRRILEELGYGLPAVEIDVPEHDVEAGYGQWSETYDVLPNPLIHVEEPVMREWIASLPPRDTLDAACGTGRHTAWLHERGHRVVGVDVSAGMLAKARERLPEVTFHEAPLTALPLASSSFDLVVCALALAHLGDMRQALAELARVVLPGGRVILSDFHPFMVALGGQGMFQKTDGSYAFVRSHPFGVSDYLTAALEAGLRPVRCAEPRWDEEALRMMGGPMFDYAPDAFREAMIGLPGALLLDLTRSTGGS